MRFIQGTIIACKRKKIQMMVTYGKGCVGVVNYAELQY